MNKKLKIETTEDGLRLWREWIESNYPQPKPSKDEVEPSFFEFLMKGQIVTSDRIENPSQKTLDFARGLQKRKKDTQDRLNELD